MRVRTLGCGRAPREARPTPRSRGRRAPHRRLPRPLKDFEPSDDEVLSGVERLLGDAGTEFLLAATTTGNFEGLGVSAKSQIARHEEASPPTRTARRSSYTE